MGWRESGGGVSDEMAYLQVILLGIFIIHDVNGLFDFPEDEVAMGVVGLRHSIRVSDEFGWW